MGQVTITLNGRTYRLECADGEEVRLLELGNHLRGHVDRLTREFGQVGEDRLLAMVAILIADELFEARDALRAAEELATNPRPVLAPTQIEPAARMSKGPKG